VRFVVDKVALGQVFLRVLRFSHVNIIPPLVLTHLHLYGAVSRRTDKWAKPGNVPNTSILSEIGEQLTEKNFHFLKGLVHLRRPGFNPRSVHIRFVGDEVALGQVYLRVLWFAPVSTIPPIRHS
jgi:branched-subunit amino acid transport protein